MRGRSAWAVGLVLLAGCSGRPALQDVEPAMTEAVRSIVGDRTPLRREVVPRCGPTDERLDGQRLGLVAEVPPDSVDVAAVADELRGADLDVELGDGRDAPLLAVASDDGWTADLWPSTEGPWRLTASAEVDGAPEAPQQPCG